MKGINDKKLVLLVDDTPANIQVVHNILKNSYTTRIATNGAKALDLAKSVPEPDLILLDVMMPDLDGYEVCSRLKLDPNTPRDSHHFPHGKNGGRGRNEGFRTRGGGLHPQTVLTGCGSGTRSNAPDIARSPRAVG